MLIIPAEKSIDWKHPPWATFTIMLICLLVFVGYQSEDDAKLTEAVDAYLEADLAQLEAPVYEAYLQRQIRFEGDADRARDLNQFQQLQAEDEQEWVAVTLLLDEGFYQYLQANQDVLWAPREQAYWQAHRPAIEDQYIRQMSGQALGLVPGRLTLYSPITYQFLHGSWGHIIGNLVVLFLLGFTVEKALGAARYLLAYLLCGALSGLVFAAVSGNSLVPLVGASGSIAGLMGLYVAMFGSRRIRFFYYLGVYFNYFRAPALALLPVWLAKELYDYFYAGATGVAYMAHVGGLAAGAALYWVFRRSLLRVQDTFFEPEGETEDSKFTARYGQAMTSLGRMDFALAERQFKALTEQYPERTVLLEHLYQLAKLRPDLPAYRERARALMNAAQSQRQPERMVAVWQEYLGKGEAHHPLAAEDHNRVLFASLRQQDFKVAEKAFERLRATANPLLLDEACRLLVQEFEKRQMEPKARHYRQFLSA